MSTYQIRITKAASADLEKIAHYIAINLQEPITALKQINRIKAAIISLQAMPERHNIVADKYLAAKGIRIMPIDNYLIFYIADKTAATVNIIRVLYNKREWEVLLK